MNRRTALRSLALVSGGLITLPSWAKEWSGRDLYDHNSSFSVTEQELLAAVADTIIPAGTSIGALSVGVDKYLQKLIDNCYEKEVQLNVKKQLAALHAASFIDSDQQQRQALLIKLSTSADKEEKDFFALIKAETIRGFSTSKEVMVKYNNYQVAPGRYYGCVNVKS